MVVSVAERIPATCTATSSRPLNLGLAVVGRRDDGFHDLRTIFQAIDLSDELWIRTRGEPGIALSVAGPEPAPEGPENLVCRAGELLSGRSGSRVGAEIHLVKRIPPQSGLGGGSSDAAAAILGLDALWGLGLSPDEHAGLALELGSDVPFFLRGGTARGEGRGERLTPLPPPPDAGWLLVLPPFGVPTVKAFASLPGTLTSSESNLRMLETAINGGNFEVFIENIVNDLEDGVVRIQPRLARIRQELISRGAAAVGLTGSGSALFAVFRCQGDAEQILENGFSPEGSRALVCEPVDFGARVFAGED